MAENERRAKMQRIWGENNKCRANEGKAKKAEKMRESEKCRENEGKQKRQRKCRKNEGKGENLNLQRVRLVGAYWETRNRVGTANSRLPWNAGWNGRRVVCQSTHCLRRWAHTECRQSAIVHTQPAKHLRCTLHFVLECTSEVSKMTSSRVKSNRN